MRSDQFADIEVREPVIPNEYLKKVTPEVLTQQWRLLCEVIKRQLIMSVPLQEKILAFVADPVDELLPIKLLKAAYLVDARTERISDRFRSKLGDFLSVPEVPKEELTPDLKNAKGLADLDATIKIFSKGYYEQKREEGEVSVRRIGEAGGFAHGISQTERKMAEVRYQFARDAKMLTLMAELLRYPPTFSTNSEVTTEHRVAIKLHDSTSSEASLFRDPKKWNSRSQLKDRVYETSLGDEAFILKERKTKYHLSPLKHGHKDGLTSKAEYDVSRDLFEHASGTNKYLQISWEEALGYVVFPDGFQCTLFRKEIGLYDSLSAHDQLVKQIEKNKPNFLQEYTDVCKGIRKKIEFDAQKKSGRYTFFQWKHENNPDVISFHDFSQVRAWMMLEEAKIRSSDQALSLGYVNFDADRLNFRVHDQTEGMLEVVNIDFEYYRKRSAEDIEGIRENSQWFRKEFLRSIGFMNWNDGSAVTKDQEKMFAYLSPKYIY